MQQYDFPTGYKAILEKIRKIDPVQYARTRNYSNGAITYLSPYISRGVISTKQVLDAVIENHFTYKEADSLIKELAWREYFQRTWQQLEDDIFDDIRRRHTGVRSRYLPVTIRDAKTGIHSIDEAIENLYTTGYMHNHLRMYVAGLACNIAKTYWQLPSQWMYYHLLDGDLASNSCSWQWVAGSFSSKQYIFNQENVNRFTQSDQQGTFLDKSYEEIVCMSIPPQLQASADILLTTKLPEKNIPVLDHTKPLLIYNSYNLDPLWRKEEDVNRILLLEPSHFKQFPISEKVMDFILSLSKNIPGLQIFAAEVNEIPGIRQFPVIYAKEHPAFKHYPGVKDQRDWMFPDVKGYHHSFYSYWKKCEEYFRQSSQGKPQLLRA